MATYVKVNKNSNYLAHHGIQGMHWGVRNGPPYPLSSNQMSSSERKAGSNSSNKSSGQVSVKKTNSQRETWKSKRQRRKQEELEWKERRDHYNNIWSEAYGAGKKWDDTPEGKKARHDFSKEYDRLEDLLYSDKTITSEDNERYMKAQERYLRGGLRAEAEYIRKKYGDQEFINYVNFTMENANLKEKATTVQEALELYEDTWEWHAD